MNIKSKNDIFSNITALLLIEARYKIMLPNIIKSYKNDLISSDDIEGFILREFKVSDNIKKLSGGRVSNVYRINQDGQYKVVKFSAGLYRMTELKREAQILGYLINSVCRYLIPYISNFKTSNNFAYIVEDYIEGISVREKLRENISTKQRLEIWECVGKILSEIHKLYQGEDSGNEWLNGQLEIARLNMENDLLDYEEFKDETPERTLSWLISNKPEIRQISLLHGDFRTKNIIINDEGYYKIIDWGFVDIGDPFYDLAIIDYYFRDNLDRESFYRAYNENQYDKDLIEYYDKLSKFVNI